MNIFKRIFGKSDGDFGLPEVSSGAPMPKCKPPKPEEKDPIRELQKRIHSLYPIGREFRYLGATMRVTNHSHYIEGNKYSSTVWPGIDCDYLNGQGSIEAISFSCLEINSWEDKPLT
jgi:hypothetical protein